MATIFCASGGSNTSPYETWAKAATSLQTAITAASTGDTVVIQYDAVPTGDAEVSADTTYAFDSNGVTLVSASNDGGSAYTPTAMGTANWIGNSTTSYQISFNGAYRFALHGITVRISGATAKSIGLGSSDNSQIQFNNCYLWLGNSNASAVIQFGNSNNGRLHFKDTTFRFGHVSQKIYALIGATIEGGSVSADGEAPSTLFGTFN